MALNKEKLKLDIYGDLSQIEMVLEEDVTTSAEKTPSDYKYNISPFRVNKNSVASIESPDISGRDVLGEVKPSSKKVDVDISTLLVDDDVSTIAATAALDTTANAAQLLVDKLKQERRATVLADRIIQHLLDNLETEEAANNIQLLRELVQYLTVRILDLNENVGELAAHTLALSTSLASVITNLQTMATTQAASGTLANPAAFTVLNTALTTENAALATVGIISESAGISRSKSQIEKDLDSTIGYKSDLERINYKNSKSII